jgi:8-oxo-dGTP pyrophosphatase MutT (NUDIX family)
MTKKYTLGIAFDHNENLVLIEKTKPEWQAGRYNFVGGKIEAGETPARCISREFEEETGVAIPPGKWKYVGKMYRLNDFVVYIYVTMNESIANVRTITEENVYLTAVESFELNSKMASKMMPNLKVMYEFIKSDDFLLDNASLNIRFPKIEPKS